MIEKCEARASKSCVCGEQVILGCTPKDLDNAYDLVCGHLCRSLVAQRDIEAAGVVFPEFEEEAKRVIFNHFPECQDEFEKANTEPAPSTARAMAGGSWPAGYAAAAPDTGMEELTAEYQVCDWAILQCQQRSGRVLFLVFFGAHRG